MGRAIERFCQNQDCTAKSVTLVRVPYRARVPKPFKAVTPKIITFDAGTPAILFDWIPQTNVKIVDLKAHDANELFSQWPPPPCLNV